MGCANVQSQIPLQNGKKKRKVKAKPCTKRRKKEKSKVASTRNIKVLRGTKKEKQMYGLDYTSCNIIASKRSSGQHGLEKSQGYLGEYPIRLKPFICHLFPSRSSIESSDL